MSWEADRQGPARGECRRSQQGRHRRALGRIHRRDEPAGRARPDGRYIADVNADPYVQAHTNGKPLKFKLLRNQDHPHIHQADWRKVVHALETLKPSPLILVGHSYGGAAAVSIARSLESGGTTVDLLCTHDTIQTFDDLGDPKVPANVRLNLNPYVIPTPAWMLAPFPIGRRNSAKPAGQWTA